MSWKTELKAADLEPERRIEVTCKRCGKMRYIRAEQVASYPPLSQSYLDEVERALRCRDRYCKGPIRIALPHQHQMEGFVGGMA